MAVRTLDRSAWSISSPLHNKLAPEDRAVHAWYRFVLSFPPHLVRTYLDEFGLGEDSCVLDPFCGTGTTLVEAKKHGIRSIGIEANPMAALASATKVDWGVDADALLAEAEKIAKAVTTELRSIDLASYSTVGVSERRSLFGLLDLDAEASQLLLADSISALPLHRSLVLLDLIANAPLRLQGHMKVALAWTLVNDAGNIRFGPEVGITAPKTDADVVGSWLGQIGRMASDLREVGDRAGVSAHVILGDSRSINGQITPNSVDAIITSPPYPNEKDYTRTTRLESVVLGLIKNKSELRALKQHLLRSNTRNVYVNDDDDLHAEDIAEVQRIAAEIEAKRIELGKTSGFERLYHRVTKLYFGGMAKHFKEMSTLLKPGAHLAYVVGDQASYLRIMIRTGILLEEVARMQGYEVVRRDLFRTRWATATKEHINEEVVILRWKGGI
ncbi:MAG: DNA methyltransferase [Armatimonadetes bacterium]|nr:DNA methyltransferase [Armatimonadota bacterium]